MRWQAVTRLIASIFSTSCSGLSQGVSMYHHDWNVASVPSSISWQYYLPSRSRVWLNLFRLLMMEWSPQNVCFAKKLQGQQMASNTFFFATRETWWSKERTHDGGKTTGTICEENLDPNKHVRKLTLTNNYSKVGGLCSQGLKCFESYHICTYTNYQRVKWTFGFFLIRTRNQRYQWGFRSPPQNKVPALVQHLKQRSNPVGQQAAQDASPRAHDSPSSPQNQHNRGRTVDSVDPSKSLMYNNTIIAIILSMYNNTLSKHLHAYRIEM